MTAHLPTIDRFLLLYLAPLLSLLVAFAGGLMARRRGWSGVVGPFALLVGWGVLGAGSWREVAGVLHPRTVAGHLVVPAAVAVLAAVLTVAWRGRGARWLAVGVAAFAGWWLAGAAGVEFWRVWAVVVALTWVLHRTGVRQGRPALAVGLVLWGGLALAGASYVWVTAGLVLAAAAAGLLGAAALDAVPPALVALGVVAAELGAGGLARGRWGLADLVCVAAVGAAAGTHAIERGLRRRLGKRVGGWGPAMAPLVAAAVAVGVAWLASHLRLH